MPPELRYAHRSLRRPPGFVAAAALALALGTGALDADVAVDPAATLREE